MFVYTAKLTKTKLALGILVCGLLICCIISFFPSSQNTVYSGDQAMDAMSQTVLKTVKSEEERVGFLENLGWEVKAESVTVTEVVIPSEFDDVYEAYNTMQKKNGYNLSKYKGKKVSLYTYAITNHPDGEARVFANILLHDNKIIGGDICSSNLDGFMHGICPLSDVQ